jgi:Carboxypeptidase regulatory-like domain/TonB dependent receptor
MRWLAARGCRGLLLFVLLAFSGVSPCHAQLTEATIRGSITDASGGTISGALVNAVNQQTGATRSSIADGSGLYLLAGMSPGSYTVTVAIAGFKSFERRGLTLRTGQTTELNVRLDVGDVQTVVEVNSSVGALPVSTEGRLSDTFEQRTIRSLPLPQRDVFLLPKLSAGATFIPGVANATKLTSSPVITVNGNRYRGNNYVLDGAMNTNPNNSGEPAIVPNLESIEEVQVQTSNFSSEFGRGNGAVVNIRTKSGTNDFHGRAWEYHRNASLNSRNYFSTSTPPQVYNQFGGHLGGPIVRNQTFFFGSYEGTRNALGKPLTFQVETPEYRNYVQQAFPDSVAARLLRQLPAPAPLPGTGGQRYVDQRDLATPQGAIPAIGRTSVLISDYVRFDQFLGRLDHSFNAGRDKLSGRWIGESQRDDSGSGQNSTANLGRVVRGSPSPFDGAFTNLNLSHVHVFDRAVNDARIAVQTVSTARGVEDAVTPTLNITGITMPFGDAFRSKTLLRTYEFRNTLTLDRGRHSLRMGFELRRIFKGLSISNPSAGSFLFNNLQEFMEDRPFRQNLTVNPATGRPTNFPRYFTLYESGLFIQEDWKIGARWNLSLGVRHDYFGTVTERESRLSSIVFGPGSNFVERLAGASITRVPQLYSPERKNFSPRIGLSFDPFGDGKTAIRSGFSMAYQPHHGQSISGARALPPDALEGVIQPGSRIGTTILYDIPVPFNPEFARGLNSQGGVVSRPGESPIRSTGFVINPDIKTQYSESWFLNLQREVFPNWIVEAGYVGTRGVNLERIDDVNRFTGDLLDGVENRINPNFGVLLFVTNGVSSSYHAVTAEVRHGFSHGFSFQANYRFSKWLDTSSDTSTGQFQDNSEPGKGAAEISCLRCERGRSLFDIPHRLAFSGVWAPQPALGNGPLGRLLSHWELSGILSAQSGRPFSVWNGASFRAGGDYNRDGGGGAVGGGFYDRPNAPADGSVKSSFSKEDYLNGLFPASLFPAPVPGTNGNLGRNTFRGLRYAALDLSLARSFRVSGESTLQCRLEAFNALNTLNLFLPDADLALGSFGKSTQAFDARTLQASLRFNF